MQKRMLSALVGIALLMTLCMNVLAAYSDNSAAQTGAASSLDATKAGVFGELSEVSRSLSSNENVLSQDALTALYEATGTDSRLYTGPDLLVNGSHLAKDVAIKQVNGTTYISVRAMVEALAPEANVSWQDNQLVASGNGFSLTARPGDIYIVVNDRYLYVPDSVLHENDVVMAPVRTICTALGATTSWEAMTGNINIATTGTPLVSGASYYNSEDLHWMSRIITAESRNQPLNGKVAVGTVIMNRVGNAQFPDSIYGVIFQPNQFQPVQNGSIHGAPNQDSIIAAKLVLDGAREAGNSLFFNRAGLDCWASRNKTLVATIGDHSFYA